MRDTELKNLKPLEEKGLGRGLRVKKNKDGSCSWIFMKRIKIKLSRKKHKDSKIVAKLVVITAENKVLLLKRSNYLEKHKKEWEY